MINKRVNCLFAIEHCNAQRDFLDYKANIIRKRIDGKVTVYARKTRPMCRLEKDVKSFKGKGSHFYLMFDKPNSNKIWQIIKPIVNEIPSMVYKFRYIAGTYDREYNPSTSPRQLEKVEKIV